jgi:hypothetical protein
MSNDVTGPLDWIEIPSRLQHHLRFNQSDEAVRFLGEFAPHLRVRTPQGDYQGWDDGDELLVQVLLDTMPLVERTLAPDMGGEHDLERATQRVIDRIPQWDLFDAIEDLAAEDRPIKGLPLAKLRHAEAVIRRELAGEWKRRILDAAKRIGRTRARSAQHSVAVDADPTPEEWRAERRAERQVSGPLGIPD